MSYCTEYSKGKMTYLIGYLSIKPDIIKLLNIL